MLAIFMMVVYKGKIYLLIFQINQTCLFEWS